MLRYFVLIAILFFASRENLLFAQKIEVIPFEVLSKEINEKSDTIKVFNFWATWCKPCIQELPYFEKASSALKNEKVKFIFVSLDFESRLQRAEEVLKNNNITGKQFLLTGDPNDWINKIDPDWQGDIPYTFMVKNGKIVKAPYAFESEEQLIDFIKQ